MRYVQYRKLGRTNLKVSRIGFGGLSITGFTHYKYPLEFKFERKVAIQTVKTALDLGINLFETGRGYGISEKIIGESIGDKREKCCLVTKTMARDKKLSYLQLQQSLMALKTDRIDVYEFHQIDSELDLKNILRSDGAMATFKNAQKEGVIDWIGISGHFPDILLKALKTNIFDVVQAPFNLINREAEKELFQFCKESDIGIMAMKPFAGGTLTFPNEFRNFILSDENIDVSDSLNFILNNKFISTILIGMRTPQEVKENINIMNKFKKLKEGDIKKLEKKAQSLLEKIGKNICNKCGYCLPCQAGIEIPTILYLAELRIKHFGQWVASDIVNQYKNLDKKVDNCINCGICEKKCPFKLPIRKKLQEAKAILQ